MATKTEETTIGANTYVVTQLGALQGRNVLLVLTRMIGPAVSGLIKGNTGERIKVSKGENDPLALFDQWGGNIAGALEAWCAHASEKDFALVCDAFAERTKVRVPTTHSNAASVDVDLSKVFDSHFAGSYGEMLLWLAFCVRFNYASFLSEIASEVTGSLAKLGIQRTASKSKSPPE